MIQSRIRQANREDAGILTEISFSSKGYWEYPKQYYDVWQSELTISPVYIESNDVWVYENSKEIFAYYSLVALKKDFMVGGITIASGHWLEHMFIRPRYIGLGLGTELFAHLRKRCIKQRITELNILADPNAKGFYEKMGCRYVKEFPSTIIGRTTPHLILMLTKDESNCR